MSEELNVLVKERNKIDDFLTRYLEEFERKMDYEDTDTPVWRLYRAKTKERAILSDKIKQLKRVM